MIKFSTKDELSNLINLEQKSLKLHISSQIELSNKLVSSITSFTEDTFDEFTSYIVKIKENITKFTNLNDKLDALNSVKAEKKINDMISEYNKSYSSLIREVFSSKIKVENFIKKQPKKESNITNINSTLNAKNSYSENTLVISEVNKVAVLPYSFTVLNDKLSKNSEYKSIDDVINKEYTIPLAYYKHTAIARFKETMDLALNREKLPYIKALSLSLEMLMNFNLHPAIITACKTLDELDVYLSCLEDNQLDDFSLFKIKYEMFPKVIPQT